MLESFILKPVEVPTLTVTSELALSWADLILNVTINLPYQVMEWV